MDYIIYAFLERYSRQSENESQDQKAEIKSLPIMEDDGEPVAAITPTGKCHQPTKQDISRDAPRHVEVIHPEDKPVRNPIPLPKDTFHFRQQHAAEQEFFAQEVVE